MAALIDAEHALDPGYAQNCGVNIDELLVSQPDTGEQALEIAEALVRSGAVDVVAIDSVAALVPRAELEGEMGDSHVGLQARLMSQALRKLTSSIGRSKTAVIFTNQLREKIGVMFGNPETTPGGRALKFYASVRLDIRRSDTIKQGTDIVGNRAKVKVVKNKVAAPFRLAEFDIMYNEGISREGGILDVGAELGMVRKSGAFFSFGETRLGQGRENSKEFLRKNPEVTAEIERQIRAVGGRRQGRAYRRAGRGGRGAPTATTAWPKSRTPKGRPRIAGKRASHRLAPFATMCYETHHIYRAPIPARHPPGQRLPGWQASPLPCGGVWPSPWWSDPSSPRPRSKTFSVGTTSTRYTTPP